MRNNNQILMVRQRTDRGKLVWSYPGGGIEQGETPEEACIREVKEETGYEITLHGRMSEIKHKHTYRAEIIGGTLSLDKTKPYNQEIVEVDWIDLQDEDKFDSITKPIRDIVVQHLAKE
ncbi:NUDIX hydrolase [Paenibacillus sp. MER TA 81-3]|uniref:NUDIX hydrolase n=1 Tax=Paenibacillus sp. MER TA 81-3 TaxID=2939573 RepID=UPI00203F3B99|nr:NUDIX hydrolase [Paenibacillus sp. MER TA 81-3]